MKLLQKSIITEKYQANNKDNKDRGYIFQRTEPYKSQNDRRHDDQ